MHEARPRPPALSYELYPPADAVAGGRLLQTIDELTTTNPDFVSVTYGGAPARRRASLDLVEYLLRSTRLRPVAHLTCRSETREGLELVVRQLLALGVGGILALRGDPPRDVDDTFGDLPSAHALVELIRDVESRGHAAEDGGPLRVGVAAYPNRHPESSSFRQDVDVLVTKQRCGADFAITQVYFEHAQYDRLVAAARAAGVTIPIIPGITPLGSITRLERLAAMTGVRPDAGLLHRLEAATSADERRKIGVHAAARLAHAALEAGAPGLHFYTFNDSRASLEVIEELDLPTGHVLATAHIA